MTPFLSRYWPGLLLATLLALLTAVPQLIAIERMGEEYRGIRPLVIDDQAYYLTRAQETWDGHSTLGSPYLFEHKDEPGVQFWIPDMLLAKVGVLLGDLHAGVIVSQLVFPFLVALLSYAILLALTRDRMLSFSVAAFLAPGLVFIPFLRSPNPQLFVTLLAGLLILLHAIPRRSRVGFGVSALLLGALFYIYPFYWTYWVVTLGLAAGLSFVFIKEKRSAYTFATVLGVGIVLGIPYLLDWHAVMQLPQYHESLLRFGTIESRFPSGPALTALSLIASGVLFLASWKRLVPRDATTALVLAGALSGAVVLNQQIITGINYFYTVHYATFIYFFTAFALAYALVPVALRALGARRYEQAKRLLCAACVLFALLSVVPHVARLATPQESDVAAQRYAPVLHFLAESAEKDAVVLANPALSTYVPAYTPQNVVWAPYAFLAYLPDTEVRTRYLLSHYFDAVFGKEEIQRTDIDVFGLRLLADYQHETQVNKVRRLFGIPEVAVSRHSEEEILRLAEEAAAVRAKPFAEAHKGLRVDYLVWDTITDPAWRVSRIPGLVRQFEGEGIIVYALPHVLP